MNIQKTPQTPKIYNKNILTFIILIISSFSLFAILYNPLDKFSFYLLDRITQTNGKNSLLFKMSYILHIISHKYILYTLLIIIYNHGNIYKSFILFSEIILGKFIVGLTQILVPMKRPYFYKQFKNPVVIDQTYAFLNEKLFIYPIFYLTVWNMLTSKLTKSSNQIHLKNTVLALIIVIIILFSASEFILGLASIGHIIFSIIMSLTIYYLVFYMIKVNFSDNRQFFRFAKNNVKRLFMGFGLIYIVICILYFFQKNRGFEAELIEDLTYQNKYEDDNKTAYFLLDSLFMTFPLCSITFVFWGFQLELKYIFEDQFTNWAQFNFEPNNDNLHGDSTGNYYNLSDRISITKGAQWNHTKHLVTLGRFLFTILLCGLCFVPYIILSRFEYIYATLFCKYVLGWWAIGLGGSFWFKYLIEKAKLSNSALWTMLRESV